MTVPTLADELLDLAAELERHIGPEPGPLGLVELPVDTLNRAARLLRTGADVVGVAHAHAEEATADPVENPYVPPAYRHRLAEHIDDARGV